MLIIVCGLPGSGKSTLARALARRMGAAVISSDVVRKRLFPRPAYSEEEKKMVYDEMARLCGAALAKGRYVVADATFYRRGERERFAAIAEREGTAARFILCTLPQEETERRLRRRRKGGPSDADFAIYLKLKAGFDEMEGGHLELDSRLPMRKRLEMCRKFIGEADG